MSVFNIVVININGQTVSSGKLPFVPRIGEKIKSNGNLFVVKDVVYDFGYDTYYGQMNVTIHVELM